MATTTRKRARRPGSGDAILTAAAAVLLEKGYRGTGVDDIDVKAGVSKQTLYTIWKRLCLSRSVSHWTLGKDRA